jgi:aminomuconate-semialdehyde/2-hydroxymuconate-6-semialdehyde dehydrogenase
MEKLQNFINGAYLDPKNGLYIDNYEPATGQIYSWIPDSDSDDVELAVEAADRAFPIWSTMSAEERSKILVNLSEGIEKRMDEFVAAESKDNGKPLRVNDDALILPYTSNVFSGEELFIPIFPLFLIVNTSTLIFDIANILSPTESC